MGDHTQVRLLPKLALGAAIIAAAVCFWPVPATPTPTAAVPYSYDAGGQAAAWNCTTPISWAINPDNAPPGFADSATQAFNELHAHTGLTFIRKPDTATIPNTTDVNDETPRAADIVIAYANPPGTGAANTSTLLDPSQSDVAGKTLTSTQYQRSLGFLRGASFHITAADVVLLIRNNKERASTGDDVVLRHELGHAMGLSHAKPSQHSLMSPVVSDAVPTLQPDDIATLQTLYRTCLTTGK